jgi:hypothetical protein
MMTRNEYKQWIAKMRLLGTLEQQRQAEERADPDGLRQFLIFLEQMHAMQQRSDDSNHDDMSNTDVRIVRQRILSKYPIK